MSVVSGDWDALRKYNLTELYAQADGLKDAAAKEVDGAGAQEAQGARAHEQDTQRNTLCLLPLSSLSFLLFSLLSAPASSLVSLIFFPLLPS